MTSHEGIAAPNWGIGLSLPRVQEMSERRQRRLKRLRAEKAGWGERAKEMVLKKHNWARKYGPPVQARWFLLSAHRHSTLVGGGAFWSRSMCMEVDAGHPQVQPAMWHDPCRNRRLCSVIFAGLLREYQRQVKPFTSACQWPHSRGTKHSRQEEIQAALRESRLKVPLVAGEHG